MTYLFFHPPREAFKTRFSEVFPDVKPGAIPVKAGVLYRFAREIDMWRHYRLPV